ncbi:MAG: hypothetical protein CME71_09330 [Halobacteriovorax sp.]|nr:hypothetical protein [Halobacteriovorax sp.]
MQIIRRYKKLSWFEFVDILDEQLKTSPECDVYFELMDELHWRLVESISEGASFKLKAQADKLVAHFAQRNLSGLSDLKEISSKF